MIKKVDFQAVSSKEGRLEKVLADLEELKLEFAEVVDAYEEAGAKPRVIDALGEALAAVDDAIDGIHEVIG